MADAHRGRFSAHWHASVRGNPDGGILFSATSHGAPDSGGAGAGAGKGIPVAALRMRRERQGGPYGARFVFGRPRKKSPG